MFKETTLVSVIVPVYNTQQYLVECISSILASDYQAFEVIIMDDGSTDHSLEIARKFEQKDPRVKVFSQNNAGASAARNHAIRMAQGTYILPVDADNYITPNYIREAAAYLDAHPEVKVVSCEVEYCGDKSGPMHFAPFSLPMLARKNMIDNCAMYRKKDWEACGGYVEHIKGREDWVFWIAMFKTGGEFYRLPILGFHYRVHANSKRKATKKLKRSLVNNLNALYPEFFEATLQGPLHYHRSWSIWLNRCYHLLHPRKWKVNANFKHLEIFVKSLPQLFKYNKGDVIYQGRNELRCFEMEGMHYVVKAFQIPHIINRIVYGFMRKSKARRSYEHAQLLLKLGISTPKPIAYYQERCGLFFNKSYYVCLASDKTIHFKDIDTLNPQQKHCLLISLGQLTARLHEAGIYHKDYSGANILVAFQEDQDQHLQVDIELLDLNRMRFGKVSIEKGCANFDRFHINEEDLKTMVSAYAQARHADIDTCVANALHYHQQKHAQA